MGITPRSLPNTSSAPLMTMEYGQLRCMTAFPFVNGARDGSSVHDSTARGDMPPAYPSSVFGAFDPWMNVRIIRMESMTGFSATVTGRSPMGPNRLSWEPKYAPPHEVMNSLKSQQDSPAYRSPWKLNP